MAIANDSDLIVANAQGLLRQFYKASQTAEGAGTWHSLWKAAGMPAAGASPPAFSAGSGYSPDKSTTGAFSLTNPTSPALTYLSRLAAQGPTIGTLIVYDRLWACSGFSTTSITEQSVTTPGNLPSGRDPNTGADVEPWVEIYTAPGATGATWTLKGTDASGNTNRNWTYTHPANAETVGQMAPMVQGGGTPAAVMGCRQVTSLTCSVSSGTAGDVGITLLRRLASIPLTAANVGAVLDAIGCGLPRVFDDACLALMVLCSTTSTGAIQGELLLGQK